jgi:hypothetical protein
MKTVSKSGYQAASLVGASKVDQLLHVKSLRARLLPKLAQERRGRDRQWLLEG